MKRSYMLSFLLAFIMFFQGYPQKRGNYDFGRMPAPPLMQNITKPGGGFSSGGASGVGGVSFDLIAHPVNNIPPKQLNFSYDPGQPDGSRFRLTINNRVVKVRLYDWMLVPLSNYVNSGYNSCFTYFGKLADKKAQKEILDNEGHVLNYHAALDNTLLGLRLADIDLMLMYEFTADPPKENGRYILGAGEPVPTPMANNDGYIQLNHHMINAIRESGQKYRSYVISDYKQDITFTQRNDSLVISGHPYYFCWRYMSDRGDFNSAKLQKEVLSRVNATINNNTGKSGKTRQEVVIEELLKAASKYEAEYHFYESGTITELIKIPAAGNKRAEILHGYDERSLEDALLDITFRMEIYKLDFLEVLSDKLSKPEVFNKANPLVWNAAEMTMRYSAFFRYLRLKYPDQWLRFISSTATVKVSPVVRTPTVLYPSGNSNIKNILHGSK